MLQSDIRQHFGQRLKIAIPQDASLAILKGIDSDASVSASDSSLSFKAMHRTIVVSDKFLILLRNTAQSLSQCTMCLVWYYTVVQMADNRSV